MGRELKRVPMDFAWPLGEIWHGYEWSLCRDSCENCKKFASIKGIPLNSYGCPDYETIKGPPIGEGYQLWETTTEGSPQSPVFSNIDDLCKWCAVNATTFGKCKATADKWREMFEADFVHHQEGNITFI